jgi:uncharacterized membrane protein
MNDLWPTLVPLVIGSAVVPVQILITVTLLRSSLRVASSWVTGMAATRLAQGVLFGFVFYEALAHSASATGPGLVGSTLLLVFAILFYVTALRKLLSTPDEDPPPPQRMANAAGMSPLGAFGAGARRDSTCSWFMIKALSGFGIP